jgi:hypothetical protein
MIDRIVLATQKPGECVPLLQHRVENVSVQRQSNLNVSGQVDVVCDDQHTQNL